MNGFIWHWHHFHCNAGFHDFYSKIFDLILMHFVREVYKWPYKSVIAFKWFSSEPLEKKKKCQDQISPQNKMAMNILYFAERI